MEVAFQAITSTLVSLIFLAHCLFPLRLFFFFFLSLLAEQVRRNTPRRSVCDRAESGSSRREVFPLLQIGRRKLDVAFALHLACVIYGGSTFVNLNRVPAAGGDSQR